MEPNWEKKRRKFIEIFGNLGIYIFEVELINVFVLLGNRCLEEGAEEFFLKPVRLADVNKLKPHMMKAKCRDEKLEKQEKERDSEEKLDKNDSRSELHKQEQQEPQQHHQQQPLLPLQQQQQQANSNKRKTVEEGLSPDRTRPRYSGLTTVV